MVGPGDVWNGRLVCCGACITGDGIGYLAGQNLPAVLLVDINMLNIRVNHRLRYCMELDK